MILAVCACRIFLNCWYLASVHDINRTEAVTLEKDLVCSGQGGRPHSFRILTRMACHAGQGSCMFRATWQFHLFRDPAGAYCNIIVDGADAVALDKDLVCSGQSGSFRQTIYFNTDGRSHRTGILYVQGGVTVPFIDILVTQTAYAVVVTLLLCRLFVLFYFYPLVWYFE